MPTKKQPATRPTKAPRAESTAAERRARPKQGPRGIVRHYDLDPNDVTSIVCGNKVIHLDKGALSVDVKSAR